jgi:hypothetical protein
VNIQVTEIQDKKTTRTYNLSGPRVETVQSFWEYLKANEVIESYEIREAK